MEKNENIIWHAFIQDRQLQTQLQELIDKKLYPLDITTGNIEDAIAYYKKNPAREAQYLILEVGDDHAIEDLNILAEVCVEDTHLIVIGQTNNINFYRQLQDMGVDDYLVLPVEIDDLRKIMYRVTHERDSTDAWQLNPLITITGARNGIGATTTSINTAYLLAEDYHVRTCLMDFDLYYGPCALGLDLEQNQGLKEALTNPERLDKVFLSRLVMQKGNNLEVLASEIPLLEPCEYKKDTVVALLKLLRRIYDITILDLPHRYIHDLPAILQQTTVLAIVTDLSVIGLRDTARLLRITEKMDETIRIKILAIRNPGVDLLSPSQFQTELNRNIDFELPFDKKSTEQALDDGIPLASKRNKLVKVLSDFTQSLSPVKKTKKQGFLDRLFE